MASIEFSRAISFQKSSRDEESRVTVTVQRAYRPNPRGRDYCSVRTGDWQVHVQFGICDSSDEMPPDAARMLANAIVEAATEAESRNASVASGPDVKDSE